MFINAILKKILPPSNLSKTTLLLTFVFLYSFAQSQNPEADSLRKLIPETPRDTVDVKNMIALSMAMFYDGPLDKSISLAIQARKLAENLNFKNGIGSALLASGYAYNLEGSYETAIKDFNEALLIFTETNHDLQIGRCHSFLAQSYQNLGQQEKSLDHLETARTYIERIGFQPGLAVIYTDIGNYYSGKGDYDIALEYFFKALKASEAAKSLAKQSMALNNIAVVYEKLQQLLKALEFYTHAYELTEQGEVTSKKALLLINLGNIYVQLGRLDEAEEKLFAGLAIAENNGNKQHESRALTNIAEYYNKKGDRTLAEKNFQKSIALARQINHRETLMNSLLDFGKYWFAQGNKINTRRYLNEALTISIELQAKEYTKDIYQLQARLDSAEGNFKSAYTWQQKFALLKDTLLQSQKAARIAYLQNLLDKEKLENQNIKSVEKISEKAETAYVSTNIWILISSLIVAFIGTIIIIIVMILKLRFKNHELIKMRDALTSSDINQMRVFNGQEK